MTFHFTKISVHLSVITVVGIFSVHKLIGWDSANIYLFQVKSRNTRKKYKICLKLTINTKESSTSVFALKCFYCWLSICKSLSRGSFLCKYYYPKPKDEQMLYLTSFKITACLLNSKYSNKSSYSTHLHEKGFLAILPKRQCCKLGTIIFSPFFIYILPSANFTFYSERLLLWFFIFYMA